MSHYNLTIDFTDASFDNDAIQNPVAPANVDVVFPITENETILDAGLASEKSGVFHNDTRTANTAAQSIALTPTDTTETLMEEFLFEFDNDINGDGTTGDTGLRVSMAGSKTGEGGEQQVKPVDIVGPFDDLTANGTLDVHIPVGFNDANSNGQIDIGEVQYQKITLGLNPADKADPNMAMFVSGDMDGADMGAGSDMAMINVDATADMSGLFQGGNGPGIDVLTLVEGVVQDNGANVDFGFGAYGDNSAKVSNYGGTGDGLYFDIAGWEVLELTSNADNVVIAPGTGKNLTNVYDAAYWNAGADNSMLKIMSGYTDGSKADVIEVNANSNIYLSFDFVDTNQGIDVEFKANGNVTVDDLGGSGSKIDVDVIYAGGSGLTIDYLEGTKNADQVTNSGTKGVTVDLGGSTGTADVFDGSVDSKNDVLDARSVSDLDFAVEGSYIKVTSGTDVNALVKDVDYIMVRDGVGAQDVDFYRDMSHLNGKFVVTDAHGNGLGSGSSDYYGKGYDVMTSAQVDEFGTSSDPFRVYYEGEHDDFIDTDDSVNVNSADGTVVMSAGDSTRGYNWEDQVEGQTQYGPGQAPGFYIEVNSKKLAVTFDDTKGEWKVDTTAIQVAEGAGSAITAINGAVLSGPDLADAVAARFGIQLRTKESDGTNTVKYSEISNDIYLNATEEAITDLLGAGVQSESYNFDYYTKVDLQAVGGDVTVNVKLAESGGSFTLDFDDLDVAVESFHNVVGDDTTPVSGVVSSSEAGEFIKIDSSGDVAFGNGGDDTYVIGATDKVAGDATSGGIHGGVAVEYGKVAAGGGLENSASDAVNFNSVDSVDDLTFRRGKYRNEEEGNTLFITDGKGNETVLFDNYNEYLDFRRVEYLTVEDGANDGEIYEIVTDENLSTWDNEIYVADGGTMAVDLGGHDYIVGSSKADTFTFSLADVVGSADAKGTIDLLQLDAADKITFTDPNNVMTTDDEGTLNSLLQAGVASGGGQVTFDFDYEYAAGNGTDHKLTVTYDSSNPDLDKTYEFII